MEILASLQNINLSFGDQRIFDQTDIHLYQNDRIGLIGLNGKGKSTLLKIISGDLTPDQSSPPFSYDKRKDLSILYIPQELSKELDQISIEKAYLFFYPELNELHKNLKEVENSEELDIEKQSKYIQSIEHLEGWSIESSYLNYIKKFDLDPNKKINQLSGGEKRKVALSVGLASKHDFILWDEPTNHLDIPSIEIFEDELSKSKQAFIMISHDRYILSNLCNRIYQISRSKVESFKGNYLDYLDHLEALEEQRQKQLTKMENRHRRELAWMRQGIKARGTRSKKRVEGYYGIEKNIQQLKDLKKKKVQLSLSHTNRKTKALFKTKDLECKVGNQLLFKNVNLDLYKGDRIALIGKNGAGKTSFIKLLENKTSSHIHYADNLKINVFSQNRISLDLSKTAVEIIGDGQDMIHLPGGVTRHVNAYLEGFLFSSSQIRRPISTLSGGERNRLQLALFMKDAADLWIFDEPTNDLDIETIEQLEKTLIDYNQSVIIISHDRAFLDKLTQKCWVIQDQTIMPFEGNFTDNADLISMDQTQTKNSVKVEQTPAQEIKPLVKLSNKEKMRLKVIDSEVEQAELKLEQSQKLLSQFDFTNPDPLYQQTYKDLESNTRQAQLALESLMEEWENLYSKVEG